MKRTTIFIAICAIFTAIVAVPFPQSISKDGFHNDDKVVAVFSDYQVKNVIQLRHLSTMYRKDFFADIIRMTLGMSVKELLVKVETTFKNLDRVTKEGVSELKIVMNIASPEIRDELNAIINTAINKVFEMIGELLKDLGRVLPAISSSITPHDPSSDIIYALLGKTLEELVTSVANALNQSLQILNRTIANFLDLATRAKPEVGKALYRIADEYLNQGKSIVIPMLDQLRQIVDVTNRVSTKRIQSQHKDFLDAIISTLLGVDIQSVTMEADNVITQLIPLVNVTRDELQDALKVAEIDKDKRDEVQAKVMDIYDKAIDDIVRDTTPILKVFLQFEEESRREKTFVYDLAVSLLGIRIETLKDYIKDASLRVEKTVKQASTKIVTTSAKAGIPSVLKIWKILNQKLKSAKLVSKPLFEALKRIVDHKPIEGGNDLSRSRGELEEGSWSENDGAPYNRDPIINAASHLLGFEVSEATKTLKTSLQNLDELMESGLVELDSILTKADPELRRDILGIMNETLTDIHITLQPLLDVLLPFLPDHVRSNKDVAVDIYVGTNGIKVDLFKRYCSSVARKIPLITDTATHQIKTRAASAGPIILGKIEALLQTTDAHTKAIIEPFIDIIGPIISPR